MCRLVISRGRPGGITVALRYVLNAVLAGAGPATADYSAALARVVARG